MFPAKHLGGASGRRGRVRAMQVLHHYESVPAAVRDGVVAIGNFDGVHRGHQAVIGRAAEVAHGLDRPLVLVTFEPHPRSFFRPDDPPFRLTPFRIKAYQLAVLGADALVMLRFDAAFSKKTADGFIQDVLVDGLGARHVVVGYDFVFGHGRGGNTELLAEAAAGGAFELTTVEPVASSDAVVYSSTAIRDHLAEGKPGHAAALLGRPFEIEGRVLHGDRRGRELGFPTMNVELGEYLLPALGVYAVRVAIEEGEAADWHDGVANLGRRPTVDGTKLLLEPHVFDFDQDVYGRRVRVALIEYIRAERRFDGLEALKRQIAEDCAAAKRILKTRAAGAT